ncbi:MAG: hypothetical protein M3Q71_04575 [Chloroflexota bacterium]|nr:hypothetical protein [Chloroflexota bacterium]
MTLLGEWCFVKPPALVAEGGRTDPEVMRELDHRYGVALVERTGEPQS